MILNRGFKALHGWGFVDFAVTAGSSARPPKNIVEIHLPDAPGVTVRGVTTSAGSPHEIYFKDGV